MRRYKWSDMLYSYDWVKAEKTNPIYKQAPGEEEFVPKSGHAVLYVINYFLDLQNSDDPSMGNKAEYLLHECLPEKQYSLRDILHFLETNI